MRRGRLVSLSALDSVGADHRPASWESCRGQLFPSCWLGNTESSQREERPARIRISSARLDVHSPNQRSLGCAEEARFLLRSLRFPDAPRLSNCLLRAPGLPGRHLACGRFRARGGPFPHLGGPGPQSKRPGDAALRARSERLRRRSLTSAREITKWRSSVWVGFPRPGSF